MICLEHARGRGDSTLKNRTSKTLTLEGLGQCAWTQVPAVSSEQPLHVLGTLTEQETPSVKRGRVSVGGLVCLYATGTG